jgi:hypothetical protein
MKTPLDEEIMGKGKFDCGNRVLSRLAIPQSQGALESKVPLAVEASFGEAEQGKDPLRRQGEEKGNKVDRGRFAPTALSSRQTNSPRGLNWPGNILLL